MKRINDTPHRRIYEKHHKRKIKQGYHIHHIDGNPKNNSIDNLLEVSPIEHFNIHYSQKDWAACMLLAHAASVDTKTLHDVQHHHGLLCVEKRLGIHNSLYDRSSQARINWINNPPGRKPVTDGNSVIKLKTEEEVDVFLQENVGWRRGVPDNHKAGLKQSKRRIDSVESIALAQKRLANGNHNFTKIHTCPHCNKQGKGPMMKRWHFDNCSKKVGK